ncbi:MAG: hypothetical protein IBJ13_13105 [Sphingopyxis sp.]|nr:hypothetical protein [Sphingopyxis sp.]
MKRILIAAGAAMLPMSAQAAESVTFTVHDVTLTAPLPAGYCIPVDRDKLIADTLAKGDTENVTLATLIRCDHAGQANGPGNDYMLIKTPKTALTAKIARSDLIGSLKAQFGTAEWQSNAAGERANATASKGLSDALATPVDIQGEIAPRGTDADCAYLGGSLNVTGGGVSYPIILGGCITSVADKAVAVYTYDDPGKGGGVAGKMRTARNVAMSIRKAN